MALGGQSLAGVARVAFEAVGLADFQQDTQRAENAYRDSTSGMSDAAIRLELSQDKLRRSLAKGPAAYRQQAAAELQVRNAERALRSETDMLSGSLNRNQREMGQSTRGAIAGSGVFKGLGRSIAFASGAFLGGAGLVYAIRSSITAAIEQDKILANLRNSLAASGFSWTKYGAQIQDATNKTKAISAFDDEELFTSLQLLVRGTGDVTKALELNSLAADVARARNMGLVQAATLLVRVNAGSVGSLRRLGIIVDKTATGTQALEQVQRKYAGAAEAFGDSAAGAAARFQVGIGDLQKAIGRGLLPQFTELTNKAADWLNSAENQARVERDVAAAVDLIEGAVRGLVSAWDAVDGPIKGVVRALGGVEKTARDLALLWVAFKVKAVAGFAATAVSSSLTSRKMVADAAVAGRAWDVATRPRVMSVSTVGGYVGARGSVPGGRRGIPPILTGNPALLTLAAVLASAGGGTQRGDRSSQYPRVYDAVMRAAKGQATPHELSILRKTLGSYSLANAPDDRMRLAESLLASGERRSRGGSPRGRNPQTDGSSGDGAGGGTPPARRRGMADIELDQARAGTPPGTADDLRYARERVSFIQRQIDFVERRWRDSEKKKAKLTQLYNDLASAEASVNAIVDDNETKIDAANENAARKRAARREAARRRMDAIERNARRSDAIREKAQRDYERARRGASGDTLTDRGTSRRRRAAAEATAAAAEKGLTAADVRRMQYDFLTKLTGEIGQWGSNFQSDGSSGQLEMNSQVQTQLLYKQNFVLERLVEGAWHPGAQLASADLSAAGWGVGF